MAKTVHLHIGTPKSGTTYVQSILLGNRERLADRAGLLCAGDTWGDLVNAARDVLSDGRNPQARGAWERITQQIDAWSGDAAVITMEWLGSVRTEQARRMVESLRPSDVKVIVTARDLARTIPAAWQEFCQNAETWSWPEFLRAVTADRPMSTEAGSLFWTQQDLGKMLAVWTDVLSPEDVTVVTVPPPGSIPNLLWARFADALGLPSAETLDLVGAGTNASLGLESAELMRRLNLVSKRENVDRRQYERVFKARLAKRVLSRRRPQEHTLRLPAEYAGWVAAKSEAMVAQVRAHRVRVCGDLADLVAEPGEVGATSTEVSDGELLEAALEGLVGLGRLLSGEVQAARRQLEAAHQAAADGAAEVARLQSKPFKRALVSVSERHRSLTRLRTVWWRLANLARRGR
ncbi:MAG TPA: hypothetical protein VFI30_01625 [Nocardioidaceae bacterium]|nr:hypothetical protein [Nocardioidaceae bacterium]